MPLRQTAEVDYADGHLDGFVLADAVHVLGQVLCLIDEPQWAVVGDTFPVGRRCSERMADLEYFAVHPDAQDPRYLTACGIPAPGCGLGAVQLPWVKPCREDLLVRSLPTARRRAGQRLSSAGSCCP